MKEEIIINNREKKRKNKQPKYLATEDESNTVI